MAAVPVVGWAKIRMDLSMLHVPGIRVCAVAPQVNRGRHQVERERAMMTGRIALHPPRLHHRVLPSSPWTYWCGATGTRTSFVRSFVSHVPHVLSRSDRLYIRDVPAACGPFAFSSLGNNELVHRSGFRSLDDDLAGRKKEREEKKRKARGTSLMVIQQNRLVNSLRTAGTICILYNVHKKSSLRNIIIIDRTFSRYNRN